MTPWPLELGQDRIQNEKTFGMSLLQSFINALLGKKFVALTARIAGCMLPVLGTIALFLGLYTNCLQGRLILVTLIIVNLSLILLPKSKHRSEPGLIAAKFVAVCIVVSIGTLLLIELLFPVMSPAQFTRIRDLSDRTNNLVRKPPISFSHVFSNEDQRLIKGNTWMYAEQEVSIGWHEAGKTYEYYGYDPNNGLRYLNRFHWNSQGFFDHDYAFEKQRNTYRIIFIGDSYVEAIQVPLSATFHKLLEAHLNQQVRLEHGLSLKYEVIGLGNSGSGQQENHDILKKLAFRYQPDMVVITLCSNDFCDDDPVLRSERNLYLQEITPILRGLLRHNYFFLGFAMGRYAEIRRNAISVHPESLQWSAHELPRIEAAWSRSFAHIKACHDHCTARQIDFRLVYLGTELEVKYALDPAGTICALRETGAPYRTITWDLDRSKRRVTLFCQDQKIRLISLLDPFVKAQHESGKKIFGDHYTFFGHEIAAAVLKKNLRLNTSLPAVP